MNHASMSLCIVLISLVNLSGRVSAVVAGPESEEFVGPLGLELDRLTVGCYEGVPYQGVIRTGAVAAC